MIEHYPPVVIYMFIIWFIMVYLKIQKKMKNPLIEDIKYPLFKKILNRVYILCAVAGLSFSCIMQPVIAYQLKKYIK